MLLTSTVAAGNQEPTPERVAAIVESVIEAEPREVVNLRLRIENRSEHATWTLNPQVSLSSGWVLLAPAGEVSLAPGESTTLVLPILVAADATAGSHTFPVDLGPGTVSGELHFTVRVQQVERVEVSLQETPQLMVNQDFSVRFLVSNRGNGPRELEFRVGSSSGFPINVSPSRVALAPGEVAPVDVSVDTPGRIDERLSHVLTLRVVDRGGAVVATGRASTGLIPQILPDESAYLVFPLRARLAASLGTGPAAEGLAGTEPVLELSGAGRLSATDPGQLTVRLNLSLTDGLEDLFLEYRREEFSVTAGRRSFARSPLSSSVTAFGVTVENRWQVGRGVTLRSRAEAFENSGALAAVGALQLDAGPDFQASATVFAHPAVDDYLATIRTSYSPVSTGSPAMELAQAAAIYGVRFHGEGDPTGHALDFDVRLRQGPSTASAGVLAISAPFSASGSHRLALTAAGNLRLNDGLGLPQGDPLNLHIDYLHERTWPAERAFLFDFLDDQSKRRERFDVDLVLAAQPVQLSLGYLSQLDETAKGKPYEVAFSLGTRLSLGATSWIDQELAWSRRYDHVRGDSSNVSYSVAGFTNLGELGSLQSEVDAVVDANSGEVTALWFGVDWSGTLWSGLDTRAELDVNLLGGESLGSLALEGRYLFRNEHELDFEVVGSLYREESPRLAVGVGYSLPLRLRLGRLPDLGEVEGVINRAGGTEVGGMIVVLGGLATVVGEDGAFRFPAVPVGTHMLGIVPQDVLTPTELVTPALPLAVQVRAGETTQVVLQVVEGAAVEGTISIVESAPVGGEGVLGREPPSKGLLANVRVELHSTADVLRTTSDAKGSFRFGHVPPGEWTLRVFHPNLGRDYRISPTDQALRLRAGETSRVQISIVPVVRQVQFIEGGVLETDDGDAE